MPEFDRKEFGRRLQAFRKQIGRSQENLGRVIKKVQQLLVDLKKVLFSLMQKKYIYYVMN